MNAKTKPAQSHKVRAAALIAAIVMSTSLFSAVVSLADCHQALADIAAGGDVHAQVLSRILMHESPVGAVQRAQCRRRHRVHIMQVSGRITVPHRPRIRRCAP